MDKFDATDIVSKNIRTINGKVLYKTDPLLNKKVWSNINDFLFHPCTNVFVISPVKRSIEIDR